MTGIVEITINGEVKQLKYANFALEAYTKLTGADIGTIKEVSEDYSQLDMTSDIIYCGLVGSCRSKGEAVTFSKEDVNRWIDDVSMVDQLSAIKEFMNSVVKTTNEMLNAFKAMSGGEEKKK